MISASNQKTIILYIIWGITIGLFILFRSNLSFPITINEAKESYTAYSIIHLGRDTNLERPDLLFRGDGNYLSTLGVYLRIPTIWIEGLSTKAVRLPSFVLGGLGIYATFLLANLLFKDKPRASFAALFISISPFFIQLNLFNLGMTAALAFAIFSALFAFKKKWKLAMLLGLLAILSDFSAIPFVFCILAWSLGLKFGKKAAVAFGFAFLSVLFAFSVVSQGFLEFLGRTTVYNVVNPQNYTYLIDQRLSFGQLYESPLIRNTVNYNRIAHNKIFYAGNAFLGSIVKGFNYERLTSPFQAGTILDKETVDSKSLPSFFFWELPLIALGVACLFKIRRMEVKILASACVGSFIIFQKESLAYSLVLISLGYANLLFSLFRVSKKPHLLLLGIAAVLMLLSLTSFYDLLRFHQEKWFSENDLRQSQIWSNISGQDIKNKKITVTDRLGEPVYYYLFYKKVHPGFFQEQKSASLITNNDIQRVDKVGSVEFKSFKYYESSRGRDEIWVGMAGEFVGENQQFDNVKEVIDGEVYYKILDVKQENKLLGNELWLVRTTFK